VVGRVRVFFIRTGIGAGALAAEVTALRARLDPELNPNPDFQAFPAGRAYALHQKILAPAAPLIAGANHLIVVPDGPLQSLPLGVLVTQPPERDPENPGEHRDIAWLARDHTITVLPSVSSLRSLRQHAAVSRAGAPFLGIGDPVLQGRRRQECGASLASMFRGYLANVDKVRELQPLPETAKELRAIAQIMGATEDDLLLGERATEPMLRQTALDRYKVIAFATHGLVSGELEGLAQPALVLTPPAEASPENDGLLTASKIATLKLDADWVVLSACNTAAGDGSPDAGGLTGLAKAFFYAGARSLLVSHWPVWSEATVALTTGAFAALAQEFSIGRAEAFRRAMIAMLEPSKPASFAHPQAWAPFILVGEGGGSK
jgi:CHAT domain-containing protein